MTDPKKIFLFPRYLGMDLDPLHAPDALKILTRPSILAPIFAVAVLNFGIEEGRHSKLFPLEAGIVLAANFLTERNRQARRKTFGSGKSIDTSPDPWAWQTKPSDAFRAERQFHVEIAFMVGAGIGATVGSAIINKGFGAPTSLAAAMLLPSLVESAYGAYNYYRVIQGDYRIVSTPTQNEPKQDRAETKSKLAHHIS